MQKFCHVLANVRYSSCPEAARDQKRLGTVDQEGFGSSGGTEVAAFPGQGGSQGEVRGAAFSEGSQ